MIDTWSSRIVPRQEPEQGPIDIADWRRDESFGIFPGGTKPKQMLFAPESAPSPLLIPNHAYLFKTAQGWRARQMWSEVIAYRIGVLMGLPVPPSFVAIDSRTGEAGALVEFFYGYPGDTSPPRLVHAADVISGLHLGLKGGRPHNVLENLRVCRVILGTHVGVRWWAKTLLFDALIGNTDRHTENWGFLVRRAPDGSPIYDLAPIFDNATSLAYELNDASVAPAWQVKDLTEYIHRGRHHCGWDMQSDFATSHVPLCKKMIEAFPDAGAEAANVIRFPMLDIAKILHDCCEFDVGVPFTQARVDFVYSLIKTRRAMLESLVSL